MTDAELLAAIDFVELSDFVMREGGLHQVVPVEDWAGEFALRSILQLLLRFFCYE